ncbi:hypothetical protein NPS68_15495 [Escherichia coli]|nr:hypothetical protein [Escherichia coli]MCQ6880921.1 hypothetical protein [Escherichia coli]
MKLVAIDKNLKAQKNAQDRIIKKQGFIKRLPEKRGSPQKVTRWLRL